MIYSRGWCCYSLKETFIMPKKPVRIDKEKNKFWKHERFDMTDVRGEITGRRNLLYELTYPKVDVSFATRHDK